MAHTRILISRKTQTSKRKDLRNALTPAEAFLWTLLKDKQLHGRRFRRQHGIGPYITDFCCTSVKLIIELDGQVHNDPIQWQYDIDRDNYLKKLGFTILRFENKDVFDHTESVLEIISNTISKT